MSAPVPPPIHGPAVSAAVELLDRERLMSLGCNGPDGWPHVSTVGYMNEGLNLYFVIGRSSHKLASLQADPRASVAIRSESGAEGDAVGLSMTGRVVEVTDPGAIDRLNLKIAERYPGVHVYCPAGGSVAVLHFIPSIISAVGVVDGRSQTQTFTLGEPGGAISQIF